MISKFTAFAAISDKIFFFLSYSIPLVLVPLVYCCWIQFIVFHTRLQFIYLVFFFFISFSFFALLLPYLNGIGLCTVIVCYGVCMWYKRKASEKKKQYSRLKRIIWFEGEKSYCYFSDGLVHFDSGRIINGNISSYRWAVNRWCLMPYAS